MIYVTKTENNIDFKIKTGYYFDILTPELMKLLRNTKSKINKNENSKNVTYLEITEVVLMHCNNVKYDYQQDSRVLHTFVFNKSFGQILDFHPRILYFKKNLNQNFHILKHGLLIKILNH